MAPTRRKRRTVLHEGVETLGSDECFLRKKAILYLLRILNGSGRLDRETLEFAFKLLEPSPEEIKEWMVKYRVLNQKELEVLTRESYDMSYFDELDFDLLVKVSTHGSRRSKLKLLKLLQEKLLEKDGLLCSSSGSSLEGGFHEFGKLFDLTPEETELCRILFMCQAWEAAEDYFERHLECLRFSGRKYLAHALNVSTSHLDTMVFSRLSQLEIVEIWSNGYWIKMEQDYLILLQKCGQHEIGRKGYRPLPPSDIPLSNHMVPQEITAHVMGLLSRRTDSPTHVLLYGPSGTGKTSYARGLASELPTPAYEIYAEKGKESSAKLNAVLTCLNFTNQSKEGSIIVVDEADEILGTEVPWFLSGRENKKGRLNQLLERPGIRMIWIVNNVESLPDTIKRRMAFSIRFRPFNRTQREGLWRSILTRNDCSDLIEEADVMELASRFEVSAGVIDMSVKKAKLACDENPQDFGKAVRLALDAYMAMGPTDASSKTHRKSETEYSLEGLHTDQDFERLMEDARAFTCCSLNQSDEVMGGLRMLFHGPPGTGKTALAHHLARVLERDLVVRRAGDILDPYVGMTERRIREAFRRAEDDEAVLLIDEADSLLFPRSRAQRSWEVSFTNELLSSMEAYRGILICTTNRLLDVDEAAVRRFTHKVGFDFLEPSGNLLFYRRMLEPLVVGLISDEDIARIRTIRDLAPGDFAVVRDRFRFHKPESHSILVEALESESRIKRYQKGSTEVGFRPASQAPDLRRQELPSNPARG